MEKTMTVIHSGSDQEKYLTPSLSGKLVIDKAPAVYVFVCVCVHAPSHVQLFATPRTAASQGPLSMEFSRQEYWRGLPFPSLGDFPNPGIKLVCLLCLLHWQH